MTNPSWLPYLVIQDLKYVQTCSIRPSASSVDAADRHCVAVSLPSGGGGGEEGGLVSANLWISHCTLYVQWATASRLFRRPVWHQLVLCVEHLDHNLINHFGNRGVTGTVVWLISYFFTVYSDHIVTRLFFFNPSILGPRVSSPTSPYSGVFSFWMLSNCEMLSFINKVDPAAEEWAAAGKMADSSHIEQQESQLPGHHEPPLPEHQEPTPPEYQEPQLSGNQEPPPPGHQESPPPPGHEETALQGQSNLE